MKQYFTHTHTHTFSVLMTRVRTVSISLKLHDMHFSLWDKFHTRAISHIPQNFRLLRGNMLVWTKYKLDSCQFELTVKIARILDKTSDV